MPKKEHTHLHRSTSEYGCCLVGIMIAENHLKIIALTFPRRYVSRKQEKRYIAA